MQQISIGKAMELFREANVFHETGVASPASELRSLAKERFGNDMVLSLLLVCYEIFHIVAREYASKYSELWNL